MPKPDESKTKNGPLGLFHLSQKSTFIKVQKHLTIAFFVKMKKKFEKQMIDEQEQNTSADGIFFYKYSKMRLIQSMKCDISLPKSPVL